MERLRAEIESYKLNKKKIVEYTIQRASDIKEIKVLKDAVACALYGIKAANGVIEITSFLIKEVFRSPLNLPDDNLKIPVL